MKKFYHNYCRWSERVIIKDDLSSLVDDRRTMPDAIVIGSGIGGLSNSKFKIILFKWGKSLIAMVSAFGSMQFKCATA